MCVAPRWISHKCDWHGVTLGSLSVPFIFLSSVQYIQDQIFTSDQQIPEDQNVNRSIWELVRIPKPSMCFMWIHLTTIAKMPFWYNRICCYKLCRSGTDGWSYLHLSHFLSWGVFPWCSLCLNTNIWLMLKKVFKVLGSTRTWLTNENAVSAGVVIKKSPLGDKWKTSEIQNKSNLMFTACLVWRTFSGSISVLMPFSINYLHSKCVSQ